MVAGDTDDTQGGISRLQLSLSVTRGEQLLGLVVCASGCVKLPVLPAGFV